MILTAVGLVADTAGVVTLVLSKPGVIVLVAGVLAIVLGSLLLASQWRKKLGWSTLGAVAILVVGVAVVAGLAVTRLPAIIHGSASNGTATTPTTVIDSSAGGVPPVKRNASEALSLTEPNDGALVGHCATFSGTSDLRSDETVVLVQRNLSDPDHVFYLEVVDDWNKPEALPHWTGRQFFSDDGAVNQKFEVQVLVVPVATVSAAMADPNNHPSWHVQILPADAESRKIIQVTRKMGVGNC